ncbi:MAG TPA: xanthine dehydrogenase family protein molybdopterin-binding subunit [Steroidobacteraceae bacterium]|nr:xanthine dehydrogenase family protein molybdopterin-binding subunit [Steroidobacteraceae bacterium]
MSDASALTRRRFVQAAAAVGGALVLAVALRRLPRRAGHASPGTATFNAYVRIAPDGTVTLVMPKVEMGQGTYTSLPMLIAEELEVDLGKVTLEAAPPAPEVYGFVPDPSADEGLKWDQSTGTSLSIIQCWTPLRRAGAAARLMLIRAASQRWRVPLDSCTAQRGEVIHTPSGRRLGYGELAAAAARLPVPKSVPLKPARDFRLIGHATQRLDTPSKVDGSARFGIDIRPPHSKVALIAISPVPGGSVAALSSDAALAVRGVRQVVNETDLIAVVADDTWAAMQGMKALDIRWNDGPNASVQQAELVAELEHAVREEGALAARKGNPARAAAGAVTHVEAIYHQPFLAHATLEPMNCTLEWRAGECEIWTGTQAPDRAVAKLAALGLSPGQIILHNQLMGGGFGRRLEVDGIVLAARIARHVSGPVRVLWERQQDIQHDRYRPYYVDRLSAALDARGRPVAWRQWIAGAGLWALYYGEPTVRNGVDPDAVTSAVDLAYPLENMEVRFVRHDPRGVPTGWWRGVGATRSVFAVESFIDELAARARQDPVAYRRALLTDERQRAVLDLAADRAGWGTPLPAGAGRGVSIQHAFGSYLAQVVEVRAGAQGRPRVERVVCAMDCGQVVNPDGVRAQLEGGATFGLSAVLGNEVTIANGRVEQTNFNDYPALRIMEAPSIEVHLIASSLDPGGVGETGTACVGAALCNAIYAATGKRVRTLPVTRGFGA